MSNIAHTLIRTPALSSRFSAWWLALGLVGSSATALRFHGLPLGLGELLLLGWLIFEWGGRISAGEFRLRGFQWRNYPLDAVALLATLGTLAATQAWANLAGHLAWHAQRDFAALIFAGGLALTLSSMKDRERFSQEMLIAFFWLAAAVSSVLLLYRLMGWSLGWDTWVFNNETFKTRFLGLAANPNQFALFVLTLPACLGLIWMHRTGVVRSVGVILGWLALMAGLATQAQALMLAWVIVAIFFLAAAGLMRNGQRAVRRAYLLVAVSIFLAFAGWLLVKQVVQNGEGGTTYAEAVQKEYQQDSTQQNQVNIRLNLYMHGLSAWVDSPWVGHGVQMVSGIDRPYQGNEAHNLLIDWMTFSGVLGLLPLLAWGGLLARHAWMRRNVLGLGALLALAVYSQFGLYARHPLFWVLVCAFAFLPGWPALASKRPR